MTKLEDIMMRYPSNLKALYLDANRLQSFHRETFSGQTSMDVLSISDNKLERIPAGVFVELINLFRLSLANNRIAVIEDNALTGLHRVRIHTGAISQIFIVVSIRPGPKDQAEDASGGSACSGTSKRCYVAISR